LAHDAQNLLVIMSDEHSTKTLGCYGSPLARTPNLDALAARGTRFDSDYCCNPVCIPARANFATGLYTHQVGYWGKGDLMGLIREDLPERKGAWKMAGMAGPGESMYTRYDRDIAARAQSWLHEEARHHTERPWVLFVSFVAPHFPLTAPSEYFYEYYENTGLPRPKLYAQHQRPTHPFIRDYAESFVYDHYFDSEDKLRRGVAGYYGLVTFLDEQVGKVLGALERTGLSASTRVVYTSDHGDNLGARGLWGKSTLYEEAAAVPLIVAGDGIPQGETVSTHTSHVDFWPFVFEATGATAPPDDEGRYQGVSMFALAAGEEPQRTVLSEYHGMGSTTGAFMVRLEHYKYVHYAGYPAQLFDLREDPEELHDRGADVTLAGVAAEARAALESMLDPGAVDAAAKQRQRELLALNGGRDAVIARGDLGFSVPPGVAPMFD
jgi:choline-sulfatase